MIAAVSLATCATAKVTLIVSIVHTLTKLTQLVMNLVHYNYVVPAFI